jgi:phospholipid/cholesterol/gamma-HCH transport system permease protein
MPDIETLRALGRFSIFSGAVAWRLVTPPWAAGDAALHTWQIATRCIAPVLAVVFPVGMVLALQGLTIFELFGAQRLLSSLVSVAVLRELSPVLASVLVAAQGGSSFAAELGAMRIKEELDATDVMAVDGLRIHVAPRVFAALIATPILYLAGCVGGMAGGYLVAVVFKGESSGVFIANMGELTSLWDLMGGMIKALTFGAIIGLVSCYQGYYTTGGAAGVGRAVNDTVVTAVVTFIVMNYFLTTALFGVGR